MLTNEEIKEKVGRIKREKGALKVYVDVRYSEPTMIPLYSEAQVTFMKEVVEGWSIFPTLLVTLFESNKKATLGQLRSVYCNMIDINE